MDHAGKSRTIKNEKPGDAHNAMNGKPISVEVDVVAQDGHVWIEVKSHKCVDLDSVEWLGVPGHAKVVSVHHYCSLPAQYRAIVFSLLCNF